MMTLFRYKNGRLRTLRITFLVFILLIGALALIYQMVRTADKVFVKIEHVFESEKKSAAQKLKQEEERVTREVEKNIPENPAKSVGEKKEASLTDHKTLKKPSSQTPPLSAEEKTKTIDSPEKTLPLERKTATIKETPSLKISREKQAQLALDPDKYFEMYQQWQAQGENSNKKSTRIGLKIHDLKNLYDLFQMKAVVVKEGVPHTDLENFSRVAAAALTEFSTTCFIVSDPWEKWGSALKDSGFSPADDIEIRYYTYEFVRNAIYARAVKAFECGLEVLNLPEDTDPSTADVSGKVYALNKKGGGSFGVFVPQRVDFQAKGSVQIDPLACFKGHKDIEALSQAGIL